MTKTLKLEGGSRLITDEMHNHILAIRQRGGKVFFCLPETDEWTAMTGSGVKCSNCDGNYRFALQVVSGGPFDSPIPSKDIASIWQGDKWYAVKTRTYNCPVCNAETDAQRFAKEQAAARGEPVPIRL